MTEQTQTNQARAFKASAARFSAAAGRCRNPDRKAELTRKAAAALKAARAVERGTYKAPVAPVTPRTAAALAAHVTRCNQALKRARNPETRAQIKARLASLETRLASL